MTDTKCKLGRIALFALVVLTAAEPARATLEVRAGIGRHNSDPEELNTGALPSIDALGAINVDLLFSPSALPVGVGIRWETLGDQNSASGARLESQISRWALLVNKRFVDSFFFGGPIATIGVSTDASLEYTLTPATPVKYKAGKTTTWSAGVEGGLTYDKMTVTGETGYQNLRAEDFTFGATRLQNASGGPLKANFSGFYAKLMVGWAF